MKKVHHHFWLVIIGMAVFCFVQTSVNTAAGDAPAVHQAIQQYEGPKTCAGCHPDAAQEVVSSLHYQQLGEAPFRVDWEAGELGGMYSTY